MSEMAGLSEKVKSTMDRSAEEFKNAGNECMKNRNFPAAIENYKLGLKVDPKNAILNCNLSQAYLNMEDYVKAEKSANSAIELQPNYVKGYYRAAKAAYGRHNVYDSMMYLANGVTKCSSQVLEDLFAMARELSPEFEKCLRRCQQAETKKAADLESVPSNSQPVRKANKVPSDTIFSGAGKTAGPLHKTSQVQDHEGDDWQKKLDEKAENKRKLEEKQKLLKRQNKEIADALERETKELEELKKEGEVKEQERKDREKKEQAKRERERIEQEKKDREKKEQEKREQDKRDREKREQEKRDREKKEHEKREREKKEAERKARELEEYQQKMRELQKQREEEEKVQKELNRIAALKNDIQSNMREGSLSLIKGLCRKAIDNLEKVLDTIKSHPPVEQLGFSDHMDLVVLQFTYSQALVLSEEYKDIVKGIKLLESMDLEGKHKKFPAIFLLLGKAFVRLNRFKEAQHPINRGLSFLSRGTSFSCYPWPGTTEVIKATERNFLQEALKSELLQCMIYHKPDAVCFYDKCLTTSHHIVPSCDIFFSDPDFIGFVTVECQEKCHINFHLSCWKDFKEHLSIEKLSEKDFLGRDCLTPDCKKKFSLEESAVIVKIAIIGPDGEEKSKCECPPPMASSQMISTLSKSPTKKQKKKELEKTNKAERSKKKRARHDSKSQGDVPLECPPTKKNSQERQYESALSKLIAARENNFGYDTTAPDANKVSHTIPTPANLKQNEEFIYTYFLEIFKTNGHMSIFELQELWEANRELLPELDPALVTHTDLVKFLLDTEGFAVVQDMIGVASDLPKISAVVESKSDPLPAVYGWQFSAATLQEASQTLSFYSAAQGNHEETGDTRAEDFNNYDCSSTCDKSSSSSSYHSVVELVESREEESSCSDFIDPVKGPILGNHTANRDGDQSVNGYASTGTETSGSDSGSYCTINTYDKSPNLSLSVELPIEKMHNLVVSGESSFSPCQDQNHENSSESVAISTASISDAVPDLPVSVELSKSTIPATHPTLPESVEAPKATIPDRVANLSVSVQSSRALNSDKLALNRIKPANGKNRLSNLPSLPLSAVKRVDLSEKLESLSINSEPNNNYKLSNVSSNCDKLTQNVLPVEQSSPRAAWKPRAKLLEWACDTFPGESKATLWDALTKVRAENNYTLSGLSFDAIGERVRSALLTEST